MARYKVVKADYDLPGEAWGVEDSLRPVMYKGEVFCYDDVCVCFSETDANAICALLNFAHENQPSAK